MADPFGTSFQPFADSGNGGSKPSEASTEPVQQAIRILSLRLPKFSGSGAIAPQGLLQGGGGMGSPFARNALGQTQQRFAPLPNLANPATNPAMTPGGVAGTGPGLFGSPSGGSENAMVQAILALAGGGMGGAIPPPHITTIRDPGTVPPIVPGIPRAEATPPTPPPDLNRNPPPPPDLNRGGQPLPPEPAPPVMNPPEAPGPVIENPPTDDAVNTLADWLFRQRFRDRGDLFRARGA